ncbi:hypothetical protein AB0K60_36665 [Thermopolyspora sp. NPDC052614]|uniref:hypothetical protein n=1 Tax=Thermopolyspora sp. NPDC052614 TaxID=3155682 RepID=UPI00342AEAF4
MGEIFVGMAGERRQAGGERGQGVSEDGVRFDRQRFEGQGVGGDLQVVQESEGVMPPRAARACHQENPDRIGRAVPDDVLDQGQ